MITAEAIHPEEHLSEIMQELGITQYGLAKAIGVPPSESATSYIAGGLSRRTRH